MPERKESGLTVLLALAANLGVAVLKLIAGLVSGSGALLSEAAHSLGDSVTEVLLLTALQRSDRPPDRRHPFGYGKERYFWSLLAAMAIFGSGAIFALYQGVHTIVDSTAGRPPVAQSGGARSRGRVGGHVVAPGPAPGQRRRSATHSRSLTAHLREPDDPTVKSVVLEDSAALDRSRPGGRRGHLAHHHRVGSVRR